MKPIAITDAHREFTDFLKQKKHSNATILAYGKDIEQLSTFLKELDKHNIHEVSQADLQAFLAKMSEKVSLMVSQGIGQRP